MSEGAAEGRWHLTGALITIAAITVWRLVCFGLTPLDLFMDEAQYWHWSRELALGYFSKPPLIGWVIRAVTELASAETAFWVRFAAPLGHAVAAVFIGFAARTIWDRPEAVWAGAAYATLPGVAVLSLFISTDDLLLPAFAVALFAWIKLRDAPSSVGWTLTLGTTLGLGLLAKYAMVYSLFGLIVMSLVTRDRHVRRAIFLAILLGLTLASPNLIWNAKQGFVTFSHTADNAGWKGVAWNWSGAGEFLVIQIVAFGPIFAAALIPAIRQAVRRGNWLPVLLTVGIFTGVTLQALIRKANGNWAAPAFVAASVLAVPWCLLHWPRLAKLGLALNLICAALVPAATMAPETVQFRGESVFTRITAPVALGDHITEAAMKSGVRAIVSDDRMMLATLTWRLRESDLSVYALPPDGLPANHYEMELQAPDDIGPVLLAVRRMPENCMRVTRPVAQPGLHHERRNLAAIELGIADRSCWE